MVFDLHQICTCIFFKEKTKIVSQPYTLQTSTQLYATNYHSFTEKIALNYLNYLEPGTLKPMIKVDKFVETDSRKKHINIISNKLMCQLTATVALKLIIKDDEIVKINNKNT